MTLSRSIRTEPSRRLCTTEETPAMRAFDRTFQSMTSRLTVSNRSTVPRIGP